MINKRKSKAEGESQQHLAVCIAFSDSALSD